MDFTQRNKIRPDKDFNKIANYKVYKKDFNKFQFKYHIPKHFKEYYSNDNEFLILSNKENNWSYSPKTYYFKNPEKIYHKNIINFRNELRKYKLNRILKNK